MKLTDLPRMPLDQEDLGDWIEHKNEYTHQLGFKECVKTQSRRSRYCNGWTNCHDEDDEPEGVYNLFMFPVRGTHAYEYGGFNRDNANNPAFDNDTDYSYRFPSQWYDIFIKKKCDLHI